MEYKGWNPNVCFAEMTLVSSLERNRSLKILEQIDRFTAPFKELIVTFWKSYNVLSSGRNR